MSIDESIKAALQLISGGALMRAWQFLVNANTRQSKDYRENFNTPVKMWEADNARLRESEAKYQAKIEQLDRKINELQSKLTVMESAHADMPIPQWLKDMDGIMLYVNNAYERAFLLPFSKTSMDYVGRIDEEIWGEETGEKYRENDRIAIMSPEKYWVGYEHITTCDGTDLGHWLIIKYVRFVGKTAIGIAGIAVPQNSATDAARRLFFEYEKTSK